MKKYGCLFFIVGVLVLLGYVAYPGLRFLYEMETWDPAEEVWQSILVQHEQLPVEVLIDSKLVRVLDLEYERKVRFIFGRLDTLTLDLPLGDGRSYMNFYLADSSLLLMEDQAGTYYFNFDTRALLNFPFHELDTMEHQIGHVRYIGAIDDTIRPGTFKTSEILPWYDITQP